MELNAILNDLKSVGGSRQHVLFETFVVNLLSEYQRKQSKEFVPYYSYKTPQGIRLEYDGYAPEGIDELPGPTAIEITFTASRSILKNKLLGYIYKVKQNPYIKSVLFINGYKLSNEFKDNIIHYSNTNKLYANVWDTTELLNILTKFNDISIESLTDLSEIIVNRTISNSLSREPDEWMVKREEQITQLKQIYKNQGIVLFLGAGISKEKGIPEWEELISDLLVELISEKLSSNEMRLNENESKFIIQKLKEMNESSPLIQARYIRTGFDKTFNQILSKILYRNSSSETPKLLKSLSTLCLPKRSGRGGVKAVVTYNFDDILETIFREAGIDSKSIYREADIPSQEELGVYHVHGFLPRNTDGYDDLSESLLVFSEDGYHSLFLKPYSWQNLVQLHFLRENTCLMIGSSMTDPNLRRLLTIPDLMRESPGHFVIMKRESYNLDSNAGNNMRPNIIEAFSAVNQELQERSSNELGLNIIWINDYSEIPGILDQIRSTK